MTRPRLLDLFCGAGGCSVGYHRAGFDVVGVDINPQPRYPFTFYKADALRTLEILMDADNGPPFGGRHFDVIHASPPCQAYAEAGTSRKRDDHPDLLGPVRDLLIAWGGPYVIENIPTAPMPNSFLLCGATFGLPLIRHRRFEVNPPLGLMPSLCPQRSHARGVTHGPGLYPYARGTWEPAWKKYVLPVVWPWMTIEESGQAIPPAYTEYIGSSLMEYLAYEDVRGAEL